MSDPIILKDKQPTSPDPSRIGISYSGGGPMVVIELGIARAFVRKQIVPVAIAGASAGALAGTAHALDPHTGKGIQVAADVLSRMSNSLLGLDLAHIVVRAAERREKLNGLGDNSPIGPRISDALEREMGLQDIALGLFQPPAYPHLMLVATDMCTGSAVFFDDTVLLSEALIASSAIPGIFPWRELSINGVQTYLGDGGVVENQPLSNLVEKYGCGTLYACAVGPTDPLGPPTSALDNALRASSLSMHQSTKLEEDYVRMKLGDRGAVHHIHPLVPMPSTNFDFTAESVRALMDQAEAQTIAWLDENHPD